MELSRLNDRGKLKFLAESDSAEMVLRQMSAHIHAKRTGDYNAAEAMMALRVSGSKQDIAPSWLITDASAHSQQEHLRKLRAKGKYDTYRADENHGSGGKGESKGGKGEIKGGKGKKKVKKT